MKKIKIKIKNHLSAVITAVSLSLFLSPSAVAGNGTPLDPVLTTIETGFSNAVAIRHAGDGSGRLFVVEQGGRIKIIENGSTLAAPFLDINTLTNGGGEQGLLGLAFHPNYSQNGFFFVYFTNTSGDTVVARYNVSAGNPNVADVNSQLIIITIDQDFSNHNGGDLHFSPIDGYLYAGMGDGGSGNDPCNRGQTKDPDEMVNTGGSFGDPDACEPDGNFSGNDNSRSLLGSIIRLDVDNPGNNVADACGEGVNYGIPADNPFSDDALGDNDCGEIWVWGLRNPYRWGFDRDTGDLYIGDVGQNTREEISFQPATSTGGENFGWVCREGFTQTPGESCTAVNAVDPIIDYSTSIGGSVIGGFPYRGPESTWQGVYIYSDFFTGDLYWTKQTNGVWEPFTTLLARPGNISGFGEDEEGNLYFTDFSNVVQITDANFSDVIFANNFE